MIVTFRLIRLISASTLALALAGGGPSARALAPAAAAKAVSWDAIYVGDSKVGHIHLWITPVKDRRGRELMNVRVDYEMSFQRGGDVAKVRMLYGTIETPEGEVLRLDTRTQAGQQDIRARGDVVDGKLTLAMEVGGQRAEKVLDWGPDVRGPYGPEMSLSREPLKPGESRAVRSFVPDLNEICVTTLTAADYEEIPLGPEGKTFRLLKVDARVADAEGRAKPDFDAIHWVDETGQILKSFVNQLGGIYIYRTTKEGALARNGRPYNLLDASIIKVPQPIANPERTRSAVYEIAGVAAGLFPADQRQAAKAAADGAVRLEVRGDGPTLGAPGDVRVDPAYLRSNPIIDSEDARVVRLAREAIAGRADAWERAVAIQRWVSGNIKSKNFAMAFNPAAAVARDLSGDCTEHSVLTAAMCRAAGVPARCVIGLVYAPDLSGFGPHMWNEVHVNGRWVAIDAAFNQSEVDATHIKLADTSLEGVAPFEAFLPVLKMMQPGVSIRPVEVR
jgi:hypothetical protein